LDVERGRTESALAVRYAALLAEVEARRSTPGPHPKPTNGQREQRAKLDIEYSRKMIELAESSPADPMAREALIWVLNKPGKPDIGEYGDEFARAASLLVRHFGDDPEAIRLGLGLEYIQSARRDSLLLGFYVSARGHEGRGLARLALAQYLACKAINVEYARKLGARPKWQVKSEGNVVREIEYDDERYAYQLELRQCDPKQIGDEAVRLFQEVIKEYGDVPYISRSQREYEALLKQPTPKRNGKPLTEEDRRAIEQRLAQMKTLGQVAEARLDEIFNLAEGKPAPEIDGLDMNGKPLKLSDYRGKVVMLVFWGSWCGPCMAQVPIERELVERFKGQPFALLGIDCEADRNTGREVMARERMTWPSWFDGTQGTGPIVSRYHIRGYPSVFVIDAKGVIRSRAGAGYEAVIERLLNELRQPDSSGTRAPSPPRLQRGD
jgi:thiol-disulfide isomerase/thioredoxin